MSMSQADSSENSHTGIQFPNKNDNYVWFKVEWDTLQYFQGWQDSKNDYNHGF